MLDLDAIRARLEGTTPGPWTPEPIDGLWGPEGDEARANSAFIAHAREDVPALLAEVEALRHEVATDDEILAHRQRLIDAVDAIEECRAHGAGCVPHAVQWVERTAAEVERLRAAVGNDGMVPVLDLAKANELGRALIAVTEMGRELQRSITNALTAVLASIPDPDQP